MKIVVGYFSWLWSPNMRCLVLCILFMVLTACQNKSITQKPNIVLIMTDQQHGRMMSAMGNPDIQTPSMDFLASNGILFSNAYCTSPVCGPARSSIITGLMPHQTGVEWNGDNLDPDILNAGEIFQREGYKTVWGGKWHLPESYPQRDSGKTIAGFDLLPMKVPPDNRWFLGSETDPPLTASVQKYLSTHDHEKPLFLAVNYHNPHDICMYSRKSGWFTEGDSLLEVRFYDFEYRLPDAIGNHPSNYQYLPPLPFNHEISEHEPGFIKEKRDNHNEYGVETMLSYNEFGDQEWQGYLNAYNRLTEEVDKEIGKILVALQENGFWENTLIIFTSDHGDGAAAHKWAAKLSLYEEPASIPMIIYWPDMKNQGLRSSQLVSQIDIFPTMLDFANIESPNQITGKSLKPLVEAKDSQWRDHLVVELADFVKDKSRKGRMLRLGDIKYNIYSSLEEQLFDLKKDPGEMVNLINDPSQKETILKCRESLKRWARETNDDFALEIIKAIQNI